MNLPQIVKNFLNSEKAVASVVPLIIATVFVFTGKITYQQWMDFATAITGIYVGGKTVQGAAVALKKGHTPEEVASALRTELAAQDAKIDAKLQAKFEEKNPNG